MRLQTFLKVSLITAMVLILLAGLGLRAYYAQGGPDWAYWLGNILLAVLFTLTGFIIVIGAAMYPDFVRRLYSLRDKRIKISNVKRIGWAVIGFLLALLGILFILVTLRYVASGCSAPGC